MFDFKAFTVNVATALNALTPKVTVPCAASGWLLLYLHRSGWMTVPEPVVVSAGVTGVVCTCLAVAGLSPQGWTAASRPFRRRLAIRRDRRRIEAELAFLQPRERQIIGCLLKTKQRMVEVLPDGEEARTLIAKGFLEISQRQPHNIHRDVCVEVPTHVWEVLVKHQSEFPFDSASEPSNPWRTHWMAR